MIPGSVDIIDLSSDSEVDIIDLCSDNEETSDFLSGRADDLDFQDPDNYSHQSGISLSTSDQNSLEESISLDGDDLFSSTQTSPCYEPVENKPTTTMRCEVPNSFPPVSHGSSVGMPHESACAVPNDQCNDDMGKLYVCNDDKKTLPLLLTNGAAVKSEHFSAPNGASSDSAHAIPNGQRMDNVGALYACKDNTRILPSSLTSGTTAKSEHSYAPYGALQFPQYFPRVIPGSFSPQSFASSYSIKGDNKIKEEPTVKSNGFQSCSVNGNGTSSSTVSTGGILADDQGLGKTISTIALIPKERVQQSRFMAADLYDTKSVLNVDDDDDVMIIMDKEKMKIEPKLDDSTLDVASSLKLPASGTLVVCPASVLKQWASELSVKVTESSKLSVLVYHGASRTKNPNELAKYDVVVTTYTTVSNEVPRENPDDEEKISGMYGISPEFCVGSKRKQPPIETKPGGPLSRVRWFRVVLDEAQTIKNYRTQVARACSALSTERRWCLSGTPIQNKRDDLYSYFCFLKYEPYCKFETLIDGEPIIKLPPKMIELSKIDFTQEERAFYLALEEGSRQKFKAYDAAGTIKDNYANILVLLLRLRQACDHPILLKGKESDLIDNTSIEMAKQLPKDEVTNLLEKLESGRVICSICNIKSAIDIINSILSTHAITEGDTVKSIPSEITPVKAIVFSQWTGMLDLLELSLSSNNIQYRRLDGKMSLNVKVMIMSLKAGNLGLNMEKKRKMVQSAFGEDKSSGNASRLTVEDLRYLFMV
ncbi:hypothetical protein PR202_gb14282 [Eleusine coracana subsp. coracana]|uniref:Helicase ATP-binding domain-containing protein n=1 Tax=Eleusine coracana subsp. coracana TaxID=191504 RepID=A0AAV5EWA1_ELECO|nr:hypothetical protein PR202_gb14282 [Eleusine coracana subsp. coracana]